MIVGYFYLVKFKIFTFVNRLKSVNQLSVISGF